MWMADRVGLKIISISLNDTNGGSFCIALSKKTAHYSEASKAIQDLRSKELEMGLHTEKPYREFTQRVCEHKAELVEFLMKIKHNDQKILGYGASTKGNVILQYCGLSKNEIPYIAEVNPDKFGAFTPGTLIPIISEKEAHDMKPDYFFVLPWHFRKGIIKKEQKYLESGGKLVFPLPEIEVFSA